MDFERAKMCEKFFKDMVDFAMMKIGQKLKFISTPKNLTDIDFEKMRMVMPINENLHPSLPSKPEDFRDLKNFI